MYIIGFMTKRHQFFSLLFLPIHISFFVSVLSGTVGTVRTVSETFGNAKYSKLTVSVNSVAAKVYGHTPLFITTICLTICTFLASRLFLTYNLVICQSLKSGGEITMSSQGWMILKVQDFRVWKIIDREACVWGQIVLQYRRYAIILYEVPKRRLDD